MATKFLRKIILEELQKVLKEGLGSDPEFAGQGNLTDPSGMPRKSAADRLPQQSFDYYAGKIKNSDIGQLQQHLIDLGYKVMPSIKGKPQMPDGYIGWRTLSAARKVFNDPSLTENDLMTAIKSYNKVAAYKVANKQSPSQMAKDTADKSVSATYDKENKPQLDFGTPQGPEGIVLQTDPNKPISDKALQNKPSITPASPEKNVPEFAKQRGVEQKTEKDTQGYGTKNYKTNESIAREVRKLLRNF